MSSAASLRLFASRAGGLANSVLFHQNSRLTASLLGGYRTLFSVQSLGLDGYERQRERTSAQFAGMSDKFREKMKEFTTSDTKNMIFTEDLKNMVHLIESNPEDLELVIKMMRRFNQQNKHLRFGNYVFGPVVMRMYYFLKQPQTALEIFKDPELDGFFDQLSSYQILCDMLYQNKMYQEVLDVFAIVKGRQVQGTKFPRNVLVLVFATCYKMNTVQSYEYALKLLQELKEVGVDPVRRVVTYAAALALNQNAPSVALEVISLAGISNYVTVRNLKILALADLGRADDCMPILRHSLEFDNPTGDRKSSVCPDVLAKVALSVEKMGDKAVITEFEKIQKALTETHQVSAEDLDSIIDAEIVPLQRDQQGQGQGFQRQNMQRSFRIGESIDLRSRRNPTYDRERRSLQSE